MRFTIFFRGLHCFSGTITNPGPRRSIPALVYLRAILYLPELVWACLGAMWVSGDSEGCDPATVGAVIAAVVARWVNWGYGYADSTFNSFKKSFEPASFLILLAQQLDHPAFHWDWRGICF